MAALARNAARKARASDPEEKKKKLAPNQLLPKPVGLQRVTSASRSSRSVLDPSTSKPEEKTKKLASQNFPNKSQPLRMTSATRSSHSKRQAEPSASTEEKTKKLAKSSQSLYDPGRLIDQFLM